MWMTIPQNILLIAPVLITLNLWRNAMLMLTRHISHNSIVLASCNTSVLSVGIYWKNASIHQKRRKFPLFVDRKLLACKSTVLFQHSLGSVFA